MDNLTHSLTGWTIARAFPQHKWGTWTAPVCILAANFPDLDFPFTPRGDKPFYLTYHRGFSHSLLGAALVVLGLSLLVMLIGWVLFRDREKRPRWGPVFAVVGVGVLSHLFLDWWNTYGIRPFFPFDMTRIHGDLTVLIDPWIWLILFVAILFGTPTRQGSAELPLPSWGREITAGALGLIGVTMIGILTVASLAGLLSWIVLAVWLSLFLPLVWFRWFRVERIAPRRMGRLGLGLVGGYLLCLAWFSASTHDRALASFRESHSEAITSSSPNPAPGVPWRYDVLIQTEEGIYQYSANALTGEVEMVREIEHNLNDPVLERIRDTREYEAWQRFARHPTMRREADVLILGDARYQLWEGRDDWTELRVALP